MLRSPFRPRLEQLDNRCLPSSYTFTELPGPTGYSEAVDVNTSGQVVGTTYDLNAGHQRAALWNGGTFTDLGTLGGPDSYAGAINDRGQVVGGAAKPDGTYRGFLINPEDTNGDNVPDRWFRDSDADGANDLMVELPLTGAGDINNLGQVIGGNVLWTPHTPNGTTGSTTTLSLSYAAALNDAGQVAGTVQIDGADHAALWHGGVTTDLGYGTANDINASGQVVGDRSQVPYSPSGFLWTPTTPNGTTGTFTVLPSLYEGSNDGGYHSSSALGVNDAGQVVGVSYSVYGGEEGGTYEFKYATLWAGGVPQNLTQQVVPALSEQLGTAVAVSNGGHVVGDMYGFNFTPTYRPFLLTPITTPLMTITDTSVTEGHTGTRAVTFTVTLSAASAQPVTVAYATANGTATAGSDYQAASGTLTFAPGETSKTITVLVYGDRLGEPNETFVVNLSSPTNATIADGQGVGTILDDEPRVSVNNASVKEGRSGKKLLTFTVTLSAAYDQAVTMSFRTADGTATTGDKDYVAKSGTLTFAPGEMTKTISIEVIGDTKKEPDEYFYLDLSGLSGNALFAKNRGVGTILNDD
jgi:probable HAF family extracellular repeat protein